MAASHLPTAEHASPGVVELADWQAARRRLADALDAALDVATTPDDEEPPTCPGCGKSMAEVTLGCTGAPALHAVP